MDCRVPGARRSGERGGHFCDRKETAKLRRAMTDSALLLDAAGCCLLNAGINGFLTQARRSKDDEL